jgi:hypothetical protein
MSLFQTNAHKHEAQYIFLVSLLLCEYAANMKHECLWFSVYNALLRVNLSDLLNDKLNYIYLNLHF